MPQAYFDAHDHLQNFGSDAELDAALRRLLGEPEQAAAMAERFAQAGIPDGLEAAPALADLVEGE